MDAKSEEQSISPAVIVEKAEPSARGEETLRPHGNLSSRSGCRTSTASIGWSSSQGRVVTQVNAGFPELILGNMGELRRAFPARILRCEGREEVAGERQQRADYSGGGHKAWPGSTLRPKLLPLIAALTA